MKPGSDEIDTEVAQLSQRPVEEIDQKIRKLGRKWDIDRAVETNASLLALAGVALAARKGRGWLLLSGAALGVLVVHGVSGWSPPKALLRRWGMLTRREIDRETYALKFLRGDFAGLDHPKSAREVTRLNQAVRMG